MPINRAIAIMTQLKMNAHIVRMLKSTMELSIFLSPSMAEEVDSILKMLEEAHDGYAATQRLRTLVGLQTRPLSDPAVDQACEAAHALLGKMLEEYRGSELQTQLIDLYQDLKDEPSQVGRENNG